jgi:hypothetical protein
VVLVVVLPEYFVALAAQGRLIAQKQRAVLGSVGCMAVGTAAFRDSLMDNGAAVHHAVVAILAKPIGRTRQELGVL